jgi:hypothetical protein
MTTVGLRQPEPFITHQTRTTIVQITRLKRGGEEKEGDRRSRGIEIITPSIKSRGGRSSSAAVRPKPNILYTAAGNKSKVFIDAIENQRILSFPDIPSNGHLDRGFFEGAAVV